MVIDTSAILAVLLNEPEAGRFRELLAREESRLMSAVSALEASCVLESRRGEPAGAELELLLYKLPVKVVAFDEEQLLIARQAWRRYGNGRHPAGLNFGDCAAYALAKASGERLLYKGEGFSRTDVEGVEE